jgi:hypothetical protein
VGDFAENGQAPRDIQAASVEGRCVCRGYATPPPHRPSGECYWCHHPQSKHVDGTGLCGVFPYGPMRH